MRAPPLQSLLLGAIVGLVLLLLAASGAFATWQLRAGDALYGGGKALDGIVIVAIDDQSLQEVGRWPWDRDVLARLALLLNQSAVVAFDIAFFEPSMPAADAALAEALRSVNAVIPAEFTSFAVNGSRVHGGGLLVPIPELSGVPTGVVNTFTDADGVTRAVPSSIDGREGFAFAAYRLLVGRPSSYDRASLLVNFAGGPGSFRTVSAADLLAGRIAPEAFVGAAVFVGATAPDLHDEHLVPTSHGRRMPGVEVHAHALHTLLTHRFLARQSFVWLAAIVLIISLALAVLFARFGVRTAALATLGLAIAYLLAAILLFRRGVIPHIVYPLLAFTCNAVAQLGIQYARERQRRKHVTSIFGKYVSQDVAEHILQQGMPELGGEEKDVTVLFADIRGFTAMSERMRPRDVITMLNHYLGEMTREVFRHRGTLDKYVGDCIMALFNTPTPDRDHTFHAVRSALAMQQALTRKHIKGVPAVGCGIGIHTGRAFVGNMGSENRLDYTAIGDTVNTASRLCSEAKAGQVLVSREVYGRVKGRVRARRLPPMKVKGKSVPLEVYEVLGLKQARKRA